MTARSLIIADDATRGVLEDALNQRNHEVTRAECFDSAIKLQSIVGFDIVFVQLGRARQSLDAMQPGHLTTERRVDYLQICRTLRQASEKPVILVAVAYSPHPDQLHAEAYGAIDAHTAHAVDDVLLLPSDSSVLAVRIRTAERLAEQTKEGDPRSSAEYWRSLVNAVPDMILTFDRSGRILFINHPPPGIPAEEVIGTDGYRYIPAEQHEILRDAIRRVFEHGEVVTYELSGIGPHRTTAWYASRAAPVCRQGEVVAAIVITTDITERKVAEDKARRLAAAEAMAAAARDKAALAEASPVGIFQTDAHGACLYVNKRWCEIAGLSAEEAAGDGWVRGLHDHDRERVIKAWNTAVHENCRFRLEYRFQHRDGRIAWVVGQAVATRDQRGDVREYIGTITDITDRKRAEQEQRRLEAQLRQKQKIESLGVMASGIAHEINNPLFALLINVDELKKRITHYRVTAPDTLLGSSTLLDDISEAGQRIRDIVHTLGIFARADDARISDLDVRAVMDASLRLANHEIRHRAELVRNYGEIPLVRGNETRLGQVFLNLLINAAHAIPDGRAHDNQICITVRAHTGDQVCVMVEDTGAGISPEVRHRIFDPFFTTKPVGRGTGLGLPICHTIVTAMGGTIDIDSSPGEGTSVRLLLPAMSHRVTDHCDAAAGLHQGESLYAWQRSLWVLVVDDDRHVRDAIRRQLLGHTVSEASNGQAALSLLSEYTYDAVLCDLMMPDLSGVDVYKTLLEISPVMAGRFIIMSGGASIPQSRDFLAQTPVPRLDKPFTAGELLALLRTVVPD
ncbi:MAG: PAS domain S-box protein [Proteobacteria bacterium]|nr:PAS domain S-box protein [Pseudomonadota bacterium]